jgi:hypothetical protein
MVDLLFPADDQPYYLPLNSARNFMHFLSNKPLARQLFPDMAKELVHDGLINLLIGGVFLICAMLLKRGKAISIWLYVGALVFSTGLEIARGADFPFFPVMIGVWVASQLLGLKKQGQLA